MDNDDISIASTTEDRAIKDFYSQHFNHITYRTQGTYHFMSSLFTDIPLVPKSHLVPAPPRSRKLVFKLASQL
jgi:hypothetical protein